MKKALCVFLAFLTLLFSACAGSFIRITIGGEEKLPTSALWLNAGSVALKVGETFALTVSGGGSVSFSSDNPAVAAVSDSGLISALSEGNANICATAKDGARAYCSVTVTALHPSITVDESATVQVGGTFRLTVTQNDIDNAAVTFQSDSAAASVDGNGVVTGVAIGSAHITVTASNGMQAVCTVTVEAPSKTVDYSWVYPLNGKTWTYQLKIPVSAYEAYHSVDRSKISGYTYYVNEKSDDAYLSALAQKFTDAADTAGYGEWDKVGLVISFVQYLDYITDIEGTGYDEFPKFPLETLYDHGGDCEDTSILLVSLLRELGYGAVMIEFDDHMGVGIKGGDGVTGYYFTGSDGSKYYYIESTGTGWGIGDLPEDYQNREAKILYLE